MGDDGEGGVARMGCRAGEHDAAAIFDAELGEDFLQVMANGVRGDAEDDGDFGVGFSLFDPAEDLGLARGEQRASGGLRRDRLAGVFE